MFSPQMMSQLKLKVPEKKQEQLSSLKRSVDAPAGGPLSEARKKQRAAVGKIRREVEAEKRGQQGNVARDPQASEELTLNNVYKNLQDPSLGGQLAAREYNFPIPTSDQQNQLLSFAKKSAMSGLGQTPGMQLETDDFNRKINALTQKAALRSFLQKDNDPYKGINLEETAKLAASMFGGDVAPVQNRPDANEEFKSFLLAKGQKQAYEASQAKEASDLLGAMYRPVITGEAQKENKQFNPYTGRGQEKEARTKELSQFLSKAEAAQEVYNKSQELAALMDEYKNTPITDYAKLSELRSKYMTLRNNLENRVRVMEAFGANYTGIERELGSANIPESPEMFALQSATGLYDKAGTLRAFGNSALRRAQGDVEMARIGYQRPSEQSLIDAKVRSIEESQGAGKIVKKPAEVDPQIKSTLEKLKGRKAR